MKIVGIILAVLMLAGSAFIGLAATNKGFDFSSEISKLTEGLDQSQKSALTKETGSPGRFKAGGVLGIVGALGCVALLVVAFVKKPIVTHIAIGTLAVTLIAAFVYPAIKVGPTDGMAPRPQMLLALGLAVVGAFGAWLASRDKKQSSHN